jgi:uncharacterized protein
VGPHGGEIGLLPAQDLRELCGFIRSLGRPIVMQTNGTLVTDEVIEILAEHRVSVGVSLNGPGALNRDRRAAPHAAAASDDATDRLTARVEANVRKMLARRLSVSLIVVLSETNAGTDDRLEQLIAWALDLEAAGVRWWRWNMLHQDFGAPRVELEPARAAAVYRRLAEVTLADPDRHWNPFREFVDNLRGAPLQPCWISPCDVYATAGVYAIHGDGSVGNCLRPAKDGLPVLRAADGPQHHRHEVLMALPFADGGCGGCKWWRWCFGGCPAEGVGGDWRSKSRFCAMYYRTYDYLLRRLRELVPDFEPREAGS